MGAAALSLALIHPSAWSSTLAIRVRSKPHRLVIPRRPAGLLDFYHLASLRRSVKSRANPQLLSHQRQSVSEGRTPLVVPSRLPKSTCCPHHPPMGEQGDHREQHQSRAGVVLRIANSVHCLWVSNPRCLRASWKVTSSCQRITNQRTIHATPRIRQLGVAPNLTRLLRCHALRT